MKLAHTIDMSTDAEERRGLEEAGEAECEDETEREGKKGIKVLKLGSRMKMASCRWEHTGVMGITTRSKVTKVKAGRICTWMLSLTNLVGPHDQYVVNSLLDGSIGICMS